MSKLDEKQWIAVERQFKVIDETLEQVNNIKDSINDLQVDVAEINMALFGKNKDNGLNSQIKKNMAAIDSLKDNMPKKPKESTSNKIRSWIPIVICVILFFGTLYTWIESSITKNIQQQTTTATPASPTP